MLNTEVHVCTPTPTSIRTSNALLQRILPSILPHSHKHTHRSIHRTIDGMRSAMRWACSHSRVQRAQDGAGTPEAPNLYHST